MSQGFFKICLSAFLLVELVGTAVVRNRTLFALDIIHYNDFHDRFEETSQLYPICPANDTNCVGGFPRLYYEIKALLREKPDALLLNAGDSFQGTYWYTLFKWNATQHFMNMLPNDAHALGNHEFDDGVGGLVPYLKALKAPVLAANLDTTLEPSLNGLFVPHIVVERKGRKIGIIGLVTPDTKKSSRPEKVEFLDPIEVVEKEAQLLKDQGVDIIIVLSHCGLSVDKAMAKTVGENIDIIVGGHSHSLLWNGDLPEDRTEEVAGSYPVVIQSSVKTGHMVLVVTASAFSRYVGNLTAYFDTEGEIVSFSGDPVYLNRSIPEDPEIKALLKPYEDELTTVISEVVGHSNDNLLADLCSVGECAIGNLVADAFLNASKKIRPSELPAVSFLMRNMIRGSLSKGDISLGAIINVMPFTNKVMTIVLPGRHLWSALERGLSIFWREKPFSGPWMPQVSGMQLTVNTTSRKVKSVLVMDGDSYQPLDMDRDYQVTAPDFLTIGQAGFKILKDNKRDEKMVGVDYKIIKEYVRLISPISDKLDNRLIVVT